MKKLVLFFVSTLLLTNIANAQTGKKHEVHKFVYMTSLGFASGVGTLSFENDTRHIHNGIPVIDVRQLIAYQFSPYAFAGVGLGIDAWKKSAFIPIYANLSVNFLDRKVSPHWYINAGYAFKWYVSSKPDEINYVVHGTKTGMYGETGLGLNLKIKDKVNMLILANYKLQDSYIRYSVNNLTEETTTNRESRMLYHFVGVKFCILY